MKVVYEWLKEYVGEEMPSVEKLDELFTFHAFEIDGIEKVNEHEVIDVKVLPDRSSDCLSHRGVAHELSALMGTKLKKDILRGGASLTPVTEKIKITIENPENCTRFGTALITGVSIKESPEWLKSRLGALGQRSINNVVDATNYVMLALGQPLHAYDAEKFPHAQDVWHFGVRMAREGEQVTTLSNETYTLKNNVQLIVDAAGDIPVGIAGIKGGKYAEIDASTTSIIIEAANFNAQVTRRGTQAIKLQTDASKRFENNISAELIPYALTNIVALILDIAGGVCEGYADAYPVKKENPKVVVTETEINALLGSAIPSVTVEDIFTRLGFTFTKDSEGWEVVAPFERTDITIAEDLIAEVGRVYGYEHITAVMPGATHVAEYNARHYYSEQVRDILVREGFSEVLTSSFRKKDEIELQNAFASDKGCIRSTLAENIREVLDRNMPNLDLLGLSRLQVFEIGTVFYRNKEGNDVSEHVSLSCGVRTKQQGYTPKDDVRLAEVQNILEEALGVSLEVKIAQGVFECNFTDAIAKLKVPTAYVPYTRNEDTLFASYSTYPFMSRDIALWTPEGTTTQDVETLIRSHAGVLLTRLTLFDTFSKDGRISYAFRLIFQSFEKTLTDEEVGVIMEKITQEAKNSGFEVR
ncbi:MAG: phenylalanine--tRNA ligase subunit beta [Minisyncoccia bacterium]